ncbi:type II toxin-antitoxin system RelE/ParE family toxin [Prosthecobacter sp.]|uniref:type II toxin-antitoxin system RelE/ParE family toxin n=1 Tax=Prosthecobacter sp. TaxID=1965333 RepID=UPI003783D486
MRGLWRSGVKIFWSSQARKDLRAIRSYIARDSSFYADRMVTRIIERTDILALHPSRAIRFMKLWIWMCGRLMQHLIASFIVCCLMRWRS